MKMGCSCVFDVFEGRKNVIGNVSHKTETKSYIILKRGCFWNLSGKVQCTIKAMQAQNEKLRDQ